MRTNRVFVLSIVVLFILGVTMSGCVTAPIDTQQPGGTQSEQVQQGDSGSSDREMVGNMYKTGFPIVKDKVTFNMVARKRVINGDFKDMIFFKNLEELTNIHIEWDAIPESQYNEKKNLLLASGDLPDAFYGSQSLLVNDLTMYGPEGMFIPLENLISEYAPNISEIFVTHPMLKAASTAPDGHIYAIGRPQQVGVSSGRDHMFIYKPWLEKLNLEMPTTLDELYNVLTAFKTQDPNENNLQDEIPFSFIFNDGNHYMGSLYGGFGIVDNLTHLLIKDDKVIFVVMQEEYKNAVSYFHNYFKEGLMDMEGFTQDRRQLTSKGNEEVVVLGSYISWHGFTISGPERQNDYVPVSPLAGSDGTRMWNKHNYTNDDISSIGFTVTSACNYPEIAIRWIDHFYDKKTSVQAMFGPIGVNIYEVSEGSYDYLPTPEGMTYDEFRFRNAPGGDSPGAIFVEDFGTLIPRQEVADIKFQNIKKYYEPYMTGEGYPSVMYTTEETHKLQTLETDIINYVNDMQAKWLTDGGIEREWDDYLAKLDQLKVDELIEVYQSAYDRFAAAK